MQVDPKLAAARLSATAARRPATGGARFSADDGAASSSSRATSLSASAATASLDALLSLQVGEDPGEKRRRSVRHGQEVLDDLDRLKAALLSGRVPASELTRLAARIAQRPLLSGDPRLDDLVGQIELRAKVELAKLGR